MSPPTTTTTEDIKIEPQRKSRANPALLALVVLFGVVAIVAIVLAALAYGSTSASPPPSPASPYSITNPDPTLLDWDEPPTSDKIVSGWLTVPLDYENPQSEKVRVRVAVLLAAKQPAATGAMLGHCGGPGSGRDCGIEGVKGMDNGVPDTFDHLGIDQRGIGESLPPNWPPTGPQTDALGTVAATCTPLVGTEEALNEALTAAYANQVAARQSPAFQTDSGANYLDFVGTTSLAHDLDLLRQAIGQEKLHIYGISYGTQVGAVYATLFPHNVGRLVLSGAVPPSQAAEDFVVGSAAAASQTAYRAVELCAQQAVQGLPCPLAATLTSLSGQALFSAVIDRYLQVYQDIFAGNVTYPYLSRTVALSPLTAHGLLSQFSLGVVTKWWEWLQVVELIASRSDALRQIVINAAVENGMKTFSCSTGGGAQSFVLGSDLDRMDNQRVLEVMRRVTRDSGPTGWLNALFWATAFSGPGVPRPAGALGNKNVVALSTASLYDAQTYYQWTSQMHGAFQSGMILTWQGGGHGVYIQQGFYDPTAMKDCLDKVAEYLRTGSVATIRSSPVCATTCEPAVGSAPNGNASCVPSVRRA